MIVAVQGTSDFDDYNVFLRAISVALSDMADDDKQVIIYSVGPANINSFVTQFSNISERSFKARGKKVKYFKVPQSFVQEQIDNIDYFAFLSKPRQPVSKLTKLAEDANIEVGIFQY